MASPILVQLTVAPDFQLPAVGTYTLFLARIGEEGWTLFTAAWSELDADRKCWMWLRTLVDEAPIPAVGGTFDVEYGPNPIGSAKVCDLSTELEAARVAKGGAPMPVTPAEQYELMLVDPAPGSGAWVDTSSVKLFGDPANPPPLELLPLPPDGLVDTGYTVS